MNNLTIKAFFEQSARDNANLPAVGMLNATPLTYNQLQKQISDLSNKLTAIGIAKGDKVAILSENRVEWVISYLALTTMGAVAVPILNDFSTKEIQTILVHSESKILLVSDKNLSRIAGSINLSFLQFVISIEDFRINQELSVCTPEQILQYEKPEETLDAQYDVQDNDLAVIIYTSGTTGEPKGVMISHSNFKKAFEIHDKRLEMNKTDHSLSFLPLTHVFERTWSLYCTYKGAAITFLEDPKKIVETLAEVKPTAFCSVPRLYQKAYHLIHAKAEESSKIKQKLFYWAKAVGVKQTHYIRTGTSAPLTQKIKYKIADLFLYKKVRAIFGGKMKLMPCAGAALSGEITQFFQSANLPVVIGYGLTETTASVSVFPKINYVYGTIGVTLPEIEVKLGAENEILVRGETVMKGYYKKPEETEKVFIEGWFKTGDAGEIDEFGNITLTDRIKDLMKTSGGKYISPQQVESLLTNDNFIEQAVLIGDNKPYATALLVPNFESLKVMAKSLNLLFANHEELVNLKTVKDFYETKLNDLQKDIAKHEKIKKFKLLGHEFSMHNGELTPTLKIKRKFVIEKFSKLIEEMYVIS